MLAYTVEFPFCRAILPQTAATYLTARDIARQSGRIARVIESSPAGRYVVASHNPTTDIIRGFYTLDKPLERIPA